MKGEKEEKNHINVNGSKDIYRRRRNILRKGSITVEAALVLPLFICAIVSIMYIIKIVYIHESVQHALNETAEELSMYSYIYNVSGFKGQNDSIKDSMSKKKVRFQDHMEDVIGVYNMFGETVDSTTQSLQDVGDNRVNDTIENIKNSEENIKNGSKKIEEIFNEIKNDPKSEVMSIINYFADSFFEKNKAASMTPVIKLIMKKYLLGSGEKDLDKKLKSLNIRDGISGLEFSESTFFEDKDSINIVLKYKIAPVLPIKFIPDIKMKQRAGVKAWLSGVGDDLEDDSDDTESVWDLGSFERGNIIRDREGANLPHYFPDIDIFNKDIGEIVNIRSINLLSKTYSNITTLKKTINKEIDRIKDFTGANKLGHNITMDMIKNRKVIIIFPNIENSQELEEKLGECKKYAEDSNVDLEIKYAYGVPIFQNSTEQVEGKGEKQK